jgi:HPt (histidine-containing phosphotransfer) domain-containing protein
MEPLYSSMADDPLLAGLIPGFVDALEARVAAMHVARAEGRLEDLKVLAHQLKGAAGGYGFKPISDAARELELDPAKLGELEALCKRAQSQP